MYKLLKAGLFRLKKEIIFWLFLFLGFVIAIFVLLKAHLSGNEMLLDSNICKYVCGKRTFRRDYKKQNYSSDIVEYQYMYLNLY